MEIKVESKELHEVLTGLSVNRSRIRGRLNRAKRQLSEIQEISGGEEDRKLYLSTLITLRESRIETINKIIERFEKIKEDAEK